MSEGNVNFSSVYHSLDAILNFLKKGEFDHLPQVEQLLAIFSANYSHSIVKSKAERLHPFIVLEGLDGSGKTTMARKLTNKLSGQTMLTPPTCLHLLRSYFDDQPVGLRRAYYGLGNYIAAREVERLVQSCPVVMDRFWHSTAAWAIADEVRDKSLWLPPASDPIYNWPEDLTKPNIVLFLGLDETVRTARHKGRNTTDTDEEQQLAKDGLFRETIIEAYKRIAGVHLVEIDASNYPNKVMKEIQEAIQHLLQQHQATD
ncbi:UMP-CMP kinase 2, mitochondrial-like [Zootermopsis nevadensis]|uniref:UMP-CMP kinase 2, mitochondrial n=1 Tax=Zootermopsis nevadensis TaxID=136037 RepID=A0A067RI83_ZOONE|nr:UMP-CMP kinase 2, mitochondrial-like [Zootermopsis nevadensis]KDR18976.1 UMP-CMP kinase 2, mitochondrial [Zootermopsis nevadensis]